MKKLYIDARENLIATNVRWKNVLDLWVGDTSDRFLHDIIRKHAKSVIGIELDEARAKKLQALWYDIRIGNAENIELNDRFDVIIAGDLIEHVNNPWIFLENVKHHLKDDGIFIFNTPNAYSINFLLRGLLFGGNVAQFPEHVILYTEDILRELLARHGLQVDKVEYFTHPENTIASRIIRCFGAISQKWHENILLVCKKD